MQHFVMQRFIYWNAGFVTDCNRIVPCFKLLNCLSLTKGWGDRVWFTCKGVQSRRCMFVEGTEDRNVCVYLTHRILSSADDNILSISRHRWKRCSMLAPFRITSSTNKLDIIMQFIAYDLNVLNTINWWVFHTIICSFLCNISDALWCRHTH